MLYIYMTTSNTDESPTVPVIPTVQSAHRILDCYEFINSSYRSYSNNLILQSIQMST